MPNKNKLKIVFLGFLLLWFLLLIKLFRVQILNHEAYKTRADEQYKKQLVLESKRGSIRDRNGKALAFNERFYSLKLEIAKFQSLSKLEQEKVIEILSNKLNREKSAFKNKVEKAIVEKKHTILLANRIPEAVWSDIRQSSFSPKRKLSDLAALYGSSIFRRAYRNTANNIVGFVDTDNRGIAGLEKQFNDALKGQNGFKIVQRDALGQLSSRTDYETKKAINGNEIRLTIDSYHQDILESELRSALDRYHAKTISGIILDPYTGEILAMSSAPSYNSNKPSSAAKRKLHGSNRVVLDTFEPGSTFKIVTAAAALEEGIIRPDDIIFCENGSYRYGPKTYRDDKHKFGNLTFKEVIEKSSNIGVIKVAEKLGKERLYRYVRDFGFGQHTGISFQGESAGHFRRLKNWSKISLPSISFGQEISVTALQMAQAYAVIANGGLLIRPHLIRSISSSRGRVLRKSQREVIRRVISKETAKTVADFLQAVVSQGTGIRVKDKDLKIAGKTGTAQVFDLEKKSYKSGKVVASFAGFFPIDKPKYVVVIVVSEPRYKNLNYGGWTAAPTFMKVAQKLVGSESYATESEYEVLKNDSNRIYLPNMLGLSLTEAKALLKSKKIPFKSTGDGNYVIHQSPREGEYEKSQFTSVELKADKKYASLMPDLKKLTIREALQKLKRFRIKIQITGSGLVKRQSIKAGKVVQKDAVLKLHLGAS